MKTASRAKLDPCLGEGPDSRRAADEQELVPPVKNGSSRSLWLWVGAAFLLLVLAWTALFTAARMSKVESVPLAARGGGL